MKKIVRKKSHKYPTIAILYHYLPKSAQKKYFSKELAIVDADTDRTVQYMKRLLIRQKYTVQVIKIQTDDLSNLQKMKADFVFNLVDSKAMEIQIVKILDRLHIPYSGSSFKAIQTSNNKLKTKHIFQKNSLPTPLFSILRVKDRVSKRRVPSKYPIIIKPAFEHCSVGITEKSIAKNYKQFKSIVKYMREKYRQTLLVEQFIPGKELQITVLETKDKTIALPIAEFTFRNGIKNKWNIYGFDEKWRKDLSVYKNCYFVSPPKKLLPDIDTKMKKDAIRAFYALGLRDYARFDLRYNPKNRKWFFLEGNANAGFSENNEDAMTASIQAHGFTLDDFVLQIVKNSIH
jgi:D-alanine-D-alanine ligase